MKKAFIISGVFISSLIGAGFASGSEVLYYFSKYGLGGLFGVIGCSLLFGILLYLVVTQSSKNCIESFDEYLKLIMSKRLAFVISVIAYIFMGVIFAAMLSGFGQMCVEVFGIRKIYGVVIMLVSSFVILKKGYSGFVRSESIMAVIISLTIIATIIYILLFRENSIATFSILDNAASSGISYVSYNILTVSSVLCVVGADADKKTAKIAAIITVGTLASMMAGMWYILCIYSGMISLGQLPFLTICMRQSSICGLIYFVIIFLSMLTTAVSNSYVLNLKVNKLFGEKVSLPLIMATGFLISGFDFSFVVDKIYRVVGIVSLMLIICILKYEKSKFIRKTEKNEEN